MSDVPARSLRVPDGVSVHPFPLVELAPDELIRIWCGDLAVQSTVVAGTGVTIIRLVGAGPGRMDFAVDHAATVQFMACPIHFAPTSEAASDDAENNSP